MYNLEWKEIIYKNSSIKEITTVTPVGKFNIMWMPNIPDASYFIKKDNIIIDDTISLKWAKKKVENNLNDNNIMLSTFNNYLIQIGRISHEFTLPITLIYDNIQHFQKCFDINIPPRMALELLIEEYEK